MAVKLRKSTLQMPRRLSFGLLILRDKNGTRKYRLVLSLGRHPARQSWPFGLKARRHQRLSDLFYGSHVDRKLPVDTSAVNKMDLGLVPFPTEPTATKAASGLFFWTEQNLDQCHWKYLCYANYFWPKWLLGKKKKVWSPVHCFWVTEHHVYVTVLLGYNNI